MDSRSEKIIVALDVGTAKEALRLVEQLSPSTSFFKIGLQLFTAAGPSFVRQLVEQRLKIFLDLKLHDIPNTVANAVRACADLGVQMTTIHLAGGREMIAAAVSAKSASLTLLGVTVLTSMDDTALRETGIPVMQQNKSCASRHSARALELMVLWPAPTSSKISVLDSKRRRQLLCRGFARHPRPLPIRNAS